MYKELIIAFWLVSGVAMASQAPANEKPALPADFNFAPKPVPLEANAIINWRQAAALEVVPKEKVKQALVFCWTPGAREPATEDLTAAQAWLQANREALEMVNASLAKPFAQWPKHDVDDKQLELVAFAYCVKARLFAADQLAEQGRFAGAAKLLEDTVKLAQMGIEGEPDLFHYLIACDLRTLTQGAILRLASRKRVPLPVLEHLLAGLPGLDSETNFYATVLQVEFTRDYNEKFDVKKFAASWSTPSATNAAELMFPDECQRPLKVLLDPTLVAFHPKPYDLNADLAETARHYRIYRTNACSAWSDRDGEVELEYEENRTNLLQDIAPLMKLLENEPLPLSRQAAQRARAAYLDLENPVGRIMDCSMSSFLGSDVRVFRCRTEREAVRTVLALLIFERRKGVLPARLSDLVAENILKSVPPDPFSGGEMLYSRERRIVWSVGEDGTDDNGKAGPGRWSGDDAVWQIPALQ
jgi:hypothetical protein